MIDDPDGQQGGGKLADQQSPEISLDSEQGDGVEYPEDPDQKAECIDEQSAACFSQTVDDAGEGAVGVKEGADPGQGEDELSSGPAAEQGKADPGAEQQKGETAEESQGKAGPGHFFDDVEHLAAVVGSLDLSHRGHQHDGNGTGHRGGKQYAGQRHAVEHAVEAQRLGGVKPEPLQAPGNGDGFDALQQVDQHPVCGQGDGKGKQLFQPPAQDSRRHGRKCPPCREPGGSPPAQDLGDAASF